MTLKLFCLTITTLKELLKVLH